MGVQGSKAVALNGCQQGDDAEKRPGKSARFLGRQGFDGVQELSRAHPACPPLSWRVYDTIRGKIEIYKIDKIGEKRKSVFRALKLNGFKGDSDET
jgi:hypothetical protein